MTDQKVKLVDLLIDFTLNTIHGFERAYYRTLPHQLLINNESSVHLAKVANKQYFNLLYKNLILRDDEFVNKKFDEMHKVFNHSYICLLNILVALCLQTHTNLDRKKLCIDSLEKYSSSVDPQLKNLLIFSRESLIQTLGHECKGKDISTFDPNEDFIK